MIPGNTPEDKLGWVSLQEDVTELQPEEVAQAYLASIVESSDDAIISKTLHGIIKSWNKSAERLFGYHASEIIGLPVTVLIPPDRQEEEERILERLRRGERVDHFETVRIRKDGTLIDVSLTISPIKDSKGRIIGASKIARDITERKRSEIEKEEMLLKEQAARAEAQAASRSKDQFLSIVSHELRSPLNSILGYNRMLRSNPHDAEQIRKTCDVIERSARMQLQLVEDLLDTARIVSGKLRLDTRLIDIVPVLSDALDVVRPAAETKGVELRSHYSLKPEMVSGDALRLQQVIWNLLTNAIKFTPAGGRVELRLERNDDEISIVVSDTGTGIKQEFLPYIFDRFRQADSSNSRRHGGLGLGLTLVKHLVELHGGMVEAASEGPGLGSTFTVTLPRAAQTGFFAMEPPALRTEDTIQLPDAVTIEGARLLVVDDHEEARMMLTDFLGKCGSIVMLASSGVEALAILADPPEGKWPDLLVCDIAMPDDDGYTLLSRVRALEAERSVAVSQQIPAIALTAMARSEDRLRALSAGFRMHIAKPVEPAELLIVIASLVGERNRGPSFNYRSEGCTQD